GRRIMRSGDSEYLINGAIARLKDVRELFMGTGAGSSAYAIIEQGRVEQILQANATSRRQVFEEAAGISRYKARRAEALRKLDRVEQNLLRLTDIVDEVEGRLNSTKSQAAKATRFREASVELKELWLGLAADDHRHLSGSLRQIESDMAGLESEVATLNASLAEAEERQAALDVDIAEIDDRLRDVEQQGSANRETIAGHNATVRHQSARRRELETELARLRQQASKFVARANEAVAEREHNMHSLTADENEFARHRDRLIAREERIGEFDGKIEQTRVLLQEHQLRIADHSKQVTDETNRAVALASQQAAAIDNRQDAERRCDEIDQQTATCQAENREYEERAGEASERAAVAGNALQELQQKRESLLREHSQFQRALAEQREQRSAGKARKSVLEDLENRQEGLGIGVKEILSRSQSSNHPPWNSILGSAADLLTVDFEYAALLEVAVGERSQLIVVKEYGPLIDYLSKGEYRIAGRVGFVVPHAMNEQESNSEQTREQLARFCHIGIDETKLPDLSQHPGVVGRADRFVKSAPQAEGLAARLLSDTWIVDAIDDALALSASDGRGCRFVTRMGELLAADGTIVVGSVRAESAIVSRKSELRSLKQDLQNLERRIAREEKRLAGLDDSLAEANDAVAGADTVHRDAVTALSVCQADVDERNREIKRLQRDREKVEAEAEKCAAQERQFRDELEQSQLRVAAAEDCMKQLDADVARSEQLVARQTQRRATLERRRGTEQLDSAKSEERLNAMREAVARLDRDLDQRQQQQSEAERRYQLVVSKCSQITLHILNTNAALAELQLIDEGSADKATETLREKRQLRDVRLQNQREIDAVRQQRRDRNDALHQQEMQLREIDGQINSFVERIEEEYQVDFKDVVASGKSAYAAYLEELRDERADEIAPTVPIDDKEETVEPADLADDESLEEEHGVEEDNGDGESAAPINETVVIDLESLSADEEMPSFEEVRDELESRVDRLRRRMKLMGNVNSESLSDLDELAERYDRLSDQLADLVEARNALDDIIRRINIESKRMFVETFEAIRGHFQDLFRKLFGGGEADIVLEDADDVLECGIDVVARPPGKELRSISLLSGGEKTMTAVALLLSIFKCRPSPFCILDEVDAALDEANLGRFVSLLQEFRESTQFIMISHRKPSMTQADVLYGVTMEQAGVSKRMNVRFEDVGEDGSFAASSPKVSDESTTQDGEMNAAA
ncbi:MAG: chromosome segregation protein SMC, partial [Planctomycetaceae bacterium]|nr:chromosome segregation protein SMC [Planctomycetaceae bacterium]